LNFAKYLKLSAAPHVYSATDVKSPFRDRKLLNNPCSTLEEPMGDAEGMNTSESTSQSELYRRRSLEEYSTEAAVQKYVNASAGAGIAYLLQHVYGPLYEEQLDKVINQKKGKEGLRILEYGCGGGMNLIWIVKRLLDRQINIDFACGTDFSAKMVQAANREASYTLPNAMRSKVFFYTVANEDLGRDLPTFLGRRLGDLRDAFHLVLGVNTFRFCFRLGTQAESANGIFSLVRPGGYSVLIDMNRYYPFFRSRLGSALTHPEDQPYLPSLDEYATVFRDAGFDIEMSGNFCWVPHSAGPAEVAILRAASPVLQRLFSRFAMRSLVVARKPW